MPLATGQESPVDGLDGLSNREFSCRIMRENAGRYKFIESFGKPPDYLDAAVFSAGPFHNQPSLSRQPAALQSITIRVAVIRSPSIVSV